MFEDVCCFTGHRYLPADRLGEIKKRLEAESEACIRQGVILFETGGALGFDTMAAHTVLRLREGYAVRLRLVLPCPEQAKLWKKEAILVWRQIRQRADETVTVSPHYFSGCMHRRNRWLVEHSGRCICCLGRETGGTAYTVRYARQRGLPVGNVWPGSDQILPLE